METESRDAPVQPPAPVRKAARLVVIKGSANDKDLLLGNHDGTGKFMIQGSTDPANPPFICGSLPSFVELRGGDYFFIPGLTALGMIATGTVDPR